MRLHVCSVLPVRHIFPVLSLPWPALILVLIRSRCLTPLWAEVLGYTHSLCNLTVTLVCLPNPGPVSSLQTAYYWYLKAEELCVWELAPSNDNLYHPLPVLTVMYSWVLVPE